MSQQRMVFGSPGDSDSDDSPCPAGLPTESHSEVMTLKTTNEVIELLSSDEEEECPGEETSEVEESLCLKKESSAKDRASQLKAATSTPHAGRDGGEGKESAGVVATGIERKSTPTSTEDAAHDEIEGKVSPDMANNDSLDEYEIQTSDFFQSHCWDCGVQLKELNGEKTFYSMHIHPLLQTPICSVCAEEVLQVERTIQEEKETTCSGCAVDDDVVLLLCDDCLRGFCFKCVAQAHGGGIKGKQTADQLSKSDEHWGCLLCSPPSELKGIQVDEEEQEKEPVTVEALIEELDRLEDELADCEVTEDDADRKRELLREEYSDSLPPVELEERVEQAVEEWNIDLRDHALRVTDSIASVQADLESHGVALDAYYKSRETKTKEAATAEPAWKAKADAELDKKEQFVYSAASRVYDLELDDCDDSMEIEDLKTSDEPPSPHCKQRRQLWNLSKDEIHRKMEDALKSEEEVLSKRIMPLHLKTVDEEQDEDANFKEERSTSCRGASSRIRRDGLLVVEKNFQKRKRASAPKTSSPRSSSRSTSQKRPPVEQKDVPPEEEESGTVAHSELPTEDLSVYGGSSLVLSGASKDRGAIAVAEPLTKVLKEHQVEGIKFMWENSFADLTSAPNVEGDKRDSSIGGCILAHSMGLGKSLQVVALLHTILHHPALALKRSNATASPSRKRVIHNVLLIAPVNTIANWDNEFTLWTGDLDVSTLVYNLNACDKNYRPRMVNDWATKGGVLLTSDRTFSRFGKAKGSSEKAIKQLHAADAVVIDEAHTMLKTSTNETFKALRALDTKRRILLTGTPLQNNLEEYFHMASFVRPECFGLSKSQFDKKFTRPIMAGLASDASSAAVSTQVKMSKELFGIMSPFMHRRDSSVLRKDLPPMQQVVIYARQSKLQARLYRSYQRNTKVNGKATFVDSLSRLRPLHNHPGCLVMRDTSSKQAKTTNTGESAAAKGSGTSDASQPAAEAPPKDSSAPSLTDAKGSGISDASQPSAEAPPKDSSAPSITDAIGSRISDASQPVAEAPPKDSSASALVDAKDSATAVTAERPSEEGSVASAEEAVQTKEVTAVSSSKSKPAGTSKPKTTRDPNFWWKEIADAKGHDSFKEAKNGKKIIILLKILAHADSIGDKVVVFSQCLRTLDFIEELLSTNEWGKYAGNQVSPAARKLLSSWRKGKEILRIDGDVDSAKRGDLIAKFNDTIGKEGKESKVFLISILAGGLGVNLTAANRVVILDNHFNPSVTEQAIFRCFRYGQTKPVFAYRFITEGSMEEKIYSRVVNKSGLAARVIDQKYPERFFTEREMTEIQEMDIWVQCDKCEKWRMLPGETQEENLPEKWHCEMNMLDSINNSCKASEKDTKWYYDNYDAMRLQSNPSVLVVEPTESSAAVPNKLENELIRRDEILSRLVEKNKQSGRQALVSKLHFHEALLEDTKADLEQESPLRVGAEGGQHSNSVAAGAAAATEGSDASLNVSKSTATGSVNAKEGTGKRAVQNEKKRSPKAPNSSDSSGKRAAHNSLSHSPSAKRKLPIADSPKKRATTPGKSPKKGATPGKSPKKAKKRATLTQLPLDFSESPAAKQTSRKSAPAKTSVSPDEQKSPRKRKGSAQQPLSIDSSPEKTSDVAKSPADKTPSKKRASPGKSPSPGKRTRRTATKLTASPFSPKGKLSDKKENGSICKKERIPAAVVPDGKPKKTKDTGNTSAPIRKPKKTQDTGTASAPIDLLDSDSD